MMRRSFGIATPFSSSHSSHDIHGRAVLVGQQRLLHELRRRQQPAAQVVGRADREHLLVDQQLRIEVRFAAIAQVIEAAIEFGRHERGEAVAHDQAQVDVRVDRAERTEARRELQRADAGRAGDGKIEVTVALHDFEGRLGAFFQQRADACGVTLAGRRQP